ncbi:MAG TPA: hypothetical protein VMQ81_00080, partial [Acidimicrobiia bacterium]|nr:hypothetical protein [Acidimicrobiia bacterium]
TATSPVNAAAVSVAPPTAAAYTAPTTAIGPRRRRGATRMAATAIDAATVAITGSVLLLFGLLLAALRPVGLDVSR